MRKFIPTLFFLLLFSLGNRAFAQLSIGTIENGPYGRGSTISVPLSISTTNSCFGSDNLIQLFLSDENGNFSSESKIGEISAYFSTHINGVIPVGAAPGSNYKLRIKTTAPASTTAYSGSIIVAAAQGPEVGVTPSSASQVLGPETFGWCGSAVGNGKAMILKLVSGSAVQNLVLKNISTGEEKTYTPTAAGFNLDNLAIGYYTITVSGSIQAGAESIKSVKTYLLMNVPSKVNIQSGGNDFGCIDPETGAGADITYSVNIGGENGIQNNYPGSSYRITWGDGKEDLLTHCELIALKGILTHNYKKTSCGQPPINLGNGTSVVNAFRVSLTTINPFCQSDPVSATTYPKIFAKPIAHIDPATATAACVNTPITFSNKSTLGNNSDCSLQMQWKWYVDGDLKSTDEVFTYAGFSTTGIHEIKLVTNNDVGLCVPSEDIRTICVQNPPNPEFTLGGTPPLMGCAPYSVKPVNTSTIDANCNAENTYTWNITGGQFRYDNNTNANSADPEFTFLEPGVYKISLSIRTASCGTVTTAEQTIIVNGSPTAVLSADVEVCNLTAYDFSNATTGPTRVELTGTQEQQADTYTWTVTGGDYAFVDGTDLHSRFPRIDFREYKTYTVTVLHTNNCGNATDAQVLTFREAAVVDAGTYAPVCNNGSIALQGKITGTVNSYAWVGGEGSFSPGRNDLKAIYTPSAGERASGKVDLTLSALTSLPQPCNVIEGFTTIAIKPANVITSSPAKSICRNAPVGYSPEATAGSTFTWTVVSSSNASGFTPNGAGTTISDVLSTPDPSASGKVVYRIIPVFDNCDGNAFDFTVTIATVPAATAALDRNTICSGETSGISLNTSQQGLKYLWTSTVSGGQITGNTQNTGTAAAVDKINDVLVNNGSVAGTVSYQITPVDDNGCTGTAVSVSVTVRPAPVITGNTISGGQPVCEGLPSPALSGTTPSGGTGVYAYQWQRSTDESTWVNIPSATGQNYNPGILQASTFFRRIVLVPNCAGQLEFPSNSVLVKINYKAKAEFTFVSDKGCVPFEINASNIVAKDYPDRNATYIWFAGTTKIGEGLTFPGYTIENANESVVITLQVKSSTGCGDDQTSHTFVSQQITTAAFTKSISEGCGPLTVSFVNTSGGSANTTFDWDFGNGQHSTQANPGPVTFPPDPSGKDKRYTITLVAKGDCGVSEPVSSTILVRAKPKAVFSPDRTNGCAPLQVTFSNTSPSASKTRYTYDFGDGSPLVSDTSRLRVPPHTYLTDSITRQYTVKMFAESPCGIDSMKYTIVVSPSTTKAELVVNGTDKRGCAPFTVSFFNNSSGADSFDYDFGDGSQAHTLTAPERVEHTFMEAGVFVVKLTAKGCSNAFTTETITVLAQPLAAFSARRNEDCNCLQVDFTNLSQEGVAYLWDFGDGGTSVEANPIHIYAQTGTYKVKLRTTNINGCKQEVVNNVIVTGIPGSLFIPNSFVPDDPNPELRVFGAKGFGLKSWRLSVFDKWGELLWETSRLDDGKPVEGWDGTFKGRSMPLGVYFWKADVEFLNGTGWKGMSYNGSRPKRAGIVNLIR